MTPKLFSPRYSLVKRTPARLALCALFGVALVACGKKEKEAEPIVPVQVTPAIKGTIKHVITADAVLFPRDQANVGSRRGRAPLDRCPAPAGSNAFRFPPNGWMRGSVAGASSGSTSSSSRSASAPAVLAAESRIARM